MECTFRDAFKGQASHVSSSVLGRSRALDPLSHHVFSAQEAADLPVAFCPPLS